MFLKASDPQTPRRLTQLHREREFSQKVFKIIDIDKLYEFKLVESWNSEYCGLSFVSNDKMNKPFLIEWSHKSVGFMLNSSKKDKWKWLVENAWENSFSKDNSSFYSKLNSWSALKELHRYDSLESFRENSLQMKFKDVRKRLWSQQQLKSVSMGRENSDVNERTFSERVNSYEQLLNSIKISKAAFDTTLNIKQSWKNDESERNDNLDVFEPLENKNYIVRVADDTINLPSENKNQQSEIEFSPKIKEFDIFGIDIKPKKKLFNLNSIYNKVEIKEKTDIKNGNLLDIIILMT